MEIKIKKINKYTNRWESEYIGGSKPKKFSRLVSSSFKPVPFLCDRIYISNVLESDLKATEKCILLYMANHLFFGTTLCLYTASGITNKIGLSYRTVRTGIADLIKKGVIFSGKILSIKGNIINQYAINPDYIFKQPEEEIKYELNFDEILCDEYDRDGFLSPADFR